MRMAFTADGMYNPITDPTGNYLINNIIKTVEFISKFTQAEYVNTGNPLMTNDEAHHVGLMWQGEAWDGCREYDITTQTASSTAIFHLADIIDASSFVGCVKVTDNELLRQYFVEHPNVDISTLSYSQMPWISIVPIFTCHLEMDSVNIFSWDDGNGHVFNLNQFGNWAWNIPAGLGLGPLMPAGREVVSAPNKFEPLPDQPLAGLLPLLQFLPITASNGGKVITNTPLKLENGAGGGTDHSTPTPKNYPVQLKSIAYPGYTFEKLTQTINNIEKTIDLSGHYVYIASADNVFTPYFTPLPSTVAAANAIPTIQATLNGSALMVNVTGASFTEELTTPHTWNLLTFNVETQSYTTVQTISTTGYPTFQHTLQGNEGHFAVQVIVNGHAYTVTCPLLESAAPFGVVRMTPGATTFANSVAMMPGQVYKSIDWTQCRIRWQHIHIHSSW